MPDEDLKQQEKNLRLLLGLSDEQISSLFQLISDQPPLSKFVAKRKAYATVFSGIQRAFVWIAGFVGAIWLGAEKIQLVIQYFITSIGSIL